MLSRVIPGNSVRAVVSKMVIDQTVFAPTIIASFFIGQGFLEGRTVDEVKEKFQRAFVPAMLANWSVWPAAQFVNFKFVPLPLQALYVNVVSLGWNTYLSLANAKHGKPRTATVTEVA